MLPEQGVCSWHVWPSAGDQPDQLWQYTGHLADRFAAAGPLQHEQVVHLWVDWKQYVSFWYYLHTANKTSMLRQKKCSWNLNLYNSGSSKNPATIKIIYIYYKIIMEKCLSTLCIFSLSFKFKYACQFSLLVNIYVTIIQSSWMNFH
jgi:hypothetical protein